MDARSRFADCARRRSTRSRHRLRRLGPLYLLILGLLLPGGSSAASAKAHHKQACQRQDRRQQRRGCTRVRRHRRVRASRAIDSAGDPLIFAGSFDNALSNYRSSFGNCFAHIDALQERFSITSSCNPGGDGLYRSDINSPQVYPAGVPECTSIPIRFPNRVAGVTDDTWLMFAETEDPFNPNQNDQPGWGMYLTSHYEGGRSRSPNQFAIGFAAYNGLRPAWTSRRVLDTNWHTLSICTNDANDGSGVVYGIWLDGRRNVFNHGPQHGSWQLHGFPIIQGDPANDSNWPLIINDYTGGSPQNELIHGAPLVSRMGSAPSPPEPVFGWNSP